MTGFTPYCPRALGNTLGQALGCSRIDEGRLERAVAFYTGSEYVPIRENAAIVPVANILTSAT